MKATVFTLELTIRVDLILLEGSDLRQMIAEIEERIEEQLSGHRTSKRLAERVSFDRTRIISEFHTEIR